MNWVGGESSRFACQKAVRIIFAGTSDFAVPALESLVAGGHQIVLVLTQPDRLAGRGLVATASPVKQLAQRRGIPVAQPATLSNPGIQVDLRNCQPDVAVVAAYGLILPEAVLGIPRYGALNIHASLLPRWRGAAPIQRALLAGDAETGVCIMRIDAGLDTGPVLLRAPVPILGDDTAGTLHHKLAALGSELIIDALERIALGTVVETPQPVDGITYAKKIAKLEACIDWRAEAATIERQVRAFNPSPGATVRLRGSELKVWRASAVEAVGVPGRVLGVDRQGVTVTCGRGALRLEEIQRAGGRRLPAAEFVRGFSISPEESFEQLAVPSRAIESSPGSPI